MQSDVLKIIAWNVSVGLGSGGNLLAPFYNRIKLKSLSLETLTLRVETKGIKHCKFKMLSKKAYIIMSCSSGRIPTGYNGFFLRQGGDFTLAPMFL